MSIFGIIKYTFKSFVVYKTHVTIGGLKKKSIVGSQFIGGEN